MTSTVVNVSCETQVQIQGDNETFPSFQTHWSCVVNRKVNVLEIIQNLANSGCSVKPQDEHKTHFNWIKNPKVSALCHSR